MKFSSAKHLTSKSKSTEVEPGDRKLIQRRSLSRTPSAPQPENNQLQSKIFSLPLELRILIYRYTIDDFGWTSSIHIVTRSQLTRASPTPWTSNEGDLPDGKKLTLVPCAAHIGDPFQISGSHYGHWPRGHLACERVASWKTAMPIDGPTRPKDFTSLSSSPMGLLLTCQRMHNEVSDYLYSTLRFDAVGLAAADRFLTLASQRQLNVMRKLHISWQTTVPIYLEPAPDKLSELDRAMLLGANRKTLWQRICRTIKRMPNLQDLRIAIYDVSWRPTPEEDLLEPLMDIHVGNGTFVVELRSKESDVGEGVREEDLFTGEADAPFQVVRRAPGLDRANVEINVAHYHGAPRRRRPGPLWYLCVPFLCVYYSIETLVEVIADEVKSRRT